MALRLATGGAVLLAMILGWAAYERVPQEVGGPLMLIAAISYATAVLLLGLRRKP